MNNCYEKQEGLREFLKVVKKEPDIRYLSGFSELPDIQQVFGKFNFPNLLLKILEKLSRKRRFVKRAQSK